MSKYSVNVEELQKAVAVSNHVIHQFEKAGKQLKDANNYLRNQTGFGINDDKITLSTQTAVLDLQKRNMERIRDCIQLIIDKTTSTAQAAKKEMESINFAGVKDAAVIGVEAASGAAVIGAASTGASVGDASIGVLKSYVNSDKNWSPNAYSSRKDYSGYNVVSGFDPAFCLNQYDYTNICGREGCTATCDCIVASIVSGHRVDVTSADWRPGAGAVWRYTDIIQGTRYSNNQLSVLYDQVSNGNPVIMRVNGHSVVAIGLKNGANPASVSMDDILVADPGDGKIKSANEIWSGWSENSGYKMGHDNSWSLRIAR